MFGSRDDHGRKIPGWDGRPDTWQEYKDEVRIWVLGSSSTAEYSLAARLVAHLRGPARRIGLSMTDEQLSADITETQLGDGKMHRDVSHTASIKLLMDRLAALAPQQQDRGASTSGTSSARRSTRGKRASASQNGCPAGKKASIGFVGTALTSP